MKRIIFITLLSLIFQIVQSNISSSQTCPECLCSTVSGDYEDPDSLIGGRYKPARTDIGGATTDEDEFKILVVFVQFQNEPYSYSTDPGAWNSGQAPNYINNLVKTTRASTSSSWWDSYNGYAISDYWHEFSRGKLHVYGQAEFIILSHEISYYNSLGL